MKVDDINARILRVDELQNEIQNRNKEYEEIFRKCKKMKNKQK